MAITIPRFRILPLRGTYAALLAEIDEINDNEICYAIDQDQYYQKEGSVLVQVGATKDQGAKADSAVQPVDISPVGFSGSYFDLIDTPNTVEVGDNISLLTNNVGYVSQLQGASLYATAAQGALADTAVQPGDNVSTLANDAGYITNAGVTQIVAGTNVTIDPVGGTGPVTVNASSSVWSQNGTTAFYDTGGVVVGGISDQRITVTDLGKVILNTTYLPTYSDPSSAIIGGEAEGTVCVNGSGMLMIAKVIG